VFEVATGSRLVVRGRGTATLSIGSTERREVGHLGMDTRENLEELVANVRRPRSAPGSGWHCVRGGERRHSVWVARLEQAFRRIRPDEVNAPGNIKRLNQHVNGACARSQNAEPRRLLFKDYVASYEF